MKTSDLEQLQLQMPPQFWAQVILTLDRKIAGIIEATGFGDIQIKFEVRNGRIKDVVFNDEVRTRVNDINTTLT